MHNFVRHIIFRSFSFSLPLALILFFNVPFASGHSFENIEGTPEGQALAPHITEQPALLFDTSTRAVLEDPLSKACSDLLLLSPEAKHFLLDRAVSFQTPGMLRLIIDPSCPLFGELSPIAAIRDPALLIGGAPEGTIYHIPSLDLIIVSNAENESVGYAMEVTGTGNMVTQFLARRSEAERLAAIGNSLYIGLEQVRSSASDANAQTSSRSREINQQKSSSIQEPTRSALSAQDQTQSTQTAEYETGNYENNNKEEGTQISNSFSSGQSIEQGTESSSADSASPEEIPLILREVDPLKTQAGSIPVIAIIIAIVTIMLVVGFILYRVLKTRIDDNPAPLKTNKESPNDDINPEA